MTHFEWGEDEPNNVGNEDCMSISHNHINFNDFSCGRTLPYFLCEFDSQSRLQSDVSYSERCDVSVLLNTLLSVGLCPPINDKLFTSWPSRAISDVTQMSCVTGFVFSRGAAEKTLTCNDGGDIGEWSLSQDEIQCISE